MTKAVLYLRQSKARDDSISLEIQEQACRAHCERHEYTVAETVLDEGVSGYRPWQDRPAFPRVLDAEAEVVVVYRWSRLSRRRLDQVSLIQLLEESGRHVEAAAEPIDPSTAGGRFSRDMMLSIAAFESDVKSEQWKEALARRTERGLPKNGLPRFGYVRDGVGYAPDPTTGPLLREMYLRYSAGAGFQALVKELNDRGVRTTRGGAWGVHSLIRALDSGFGAGLLIQKSDNNYLPGAHEPVITEEEWQAYVRARERRKQLPVKRRNPRWYLAGLVRCGECGAPLIVNSYSSTKSQVICSRYKNQRACAGVWINRRTVEDAVAIWLGAHLDELAPGLPSRVERHAAVQAHADELRASLAAVDAALGRLAAGWASGVLDEVGYRSAQQGLLAQRDDLARRVHEALDEALRVGPIDTDVFTKLKFTPPLTAGEWGMAIGKVLRRVDVRRGGALTFTPVIAV